MKKISKRMRKQRKIKKRKTLLWITCSMMYVKMKLKSRKRIETVLLINKRKIYTNILLTSISLYGENNGFFIRLYLGEILSFFSHLVFRS